MGVFRSDDITQLKIRMPGDTESAVSLMDSLGKLMEDAIEFIDLTQSSPSQLKPFAPMLKRCETMEATISNLLSFSKDFDQTIFCYSTFEFFINDLSHDQRLKDLNFGSYYDLVETEILDYERKTIEMIESYNKIKEELIIELEKKMVFAEYFSLVSVDLNDSQSEGPLGYIMGVIKASDDIKMNRMILRASHGRVMATFRDFKYPEEYQGIVMQKNKEKPKKIFIMFYPAEGRDVLLRKLLQICDLLSASMYKPPEDLDRATTNSNLMNNIKEKQEYLNQADASIKNYLKELLGSVTKPGKIDMYRLYFKKEKLIYANLSKCLLRENFIDGEVWVLTQKIDLLKQVIAGSAGDQAKGSFIELERNQLTKPTYIPSNDFLYPFQLIVNTYGIPRYKEINPAFFNIVTFPFLFGVMFGDIGHGLIILCFGVYMCWYSDDIRKRPKSPLNVFVQVRYFLLLLGLTSFYCGFMYNEFLSLPLPLFGECYKHGLNDTEAYKKTINCVYPIGFDPEWYVASNELAYVNSFKMKFSVIFGVIHMLFGIILKGLNDIFFRNYLNFFFEFLPEVIFMSFLFGYMIIMIIIKWCTDWSLKATAAPSLITIMINIFIKHGSVNDMPVWGETQNQAADIRTYSQETFNKAVLIIVIALIPIMIFPKPLIEYCLYRKGKRLGSASYDAGNVQINATNLRREDEEAEGTKGFIDFFINQSIEMIEFILGTVSNTASYLRLWALSLAHVELTKVFFDKTMLEQIIEGDYQFGLGFLEVFIGYFAFANITFFVLIGMDFMECFLHTLRLHWVEFQSKFYKADGYLFVPYSFKDLVDKQFDSKMI